MKQSQKFVNILNIIHKLKRYNFIYLGRFYFFKQYNVTAVLYICQRKCYIMECEDEIYMYKWIYVNETKCNYIFQLLYVHLWKKLCSIIQWSLFVFIFI